MMRVPSPQRLTQRRQSGNINKVSIGVTMKAEAYPQEPSKQEPRAPACANRPPIINAVNNEEKNANIIKLPYSQKLNAVPHVLQDIQCTPNEAI